MAYPFTLLTVISLVIVGCDHRHQSSPARQPSVASQAAEQRLVPQPAAIPGDVSFSTIDSSTLPGIKRSLDVRLNKKVSLQTLQAIALKLKAQDSRTYERTFIAYYLPGMVVDAGAWATTHFNPTLKVRILGLTAEEEQTIAAHPEPASRDVIGRWLDENPYLPHRITIFRADGKVFIEQMFQDGSSSKKEVSEKKTPLGQRFDKVQESSDGHHWFLGSDGNLQSRDNAGLIDTARKTE